MLRLGVCYEQQAYVRFALSIDRPQQAIFRLESVAVDVR
jgi:hypothetical protein